MNTFAIFQDNYGRKFTFNAWDYQDALTQLFKWCRYHSIDPDIMHVVQVKNNDTHDLHNEFMTE